MADLRRLAADGALPRVIEAYFRTPQPAEELYDVAADPDEMRNLAKEPGYAKTLDRMSRQLDAWLSAVGDLGRLSESDMLEIYMWPAG